MLAGWKTYVLALVVFALLAVLAIRQGPNWGYIVQLIAHSKVQWVVLATAIPISFGAVFSSGAFADTSFGHRTADARAVFAACSPGFYYNGGQ